MSRKTLLTLLFLEVIVALNAGLVFKIFESRLLAATVAGSGFILVGLAIVVAAIRAKPLKHPNGPWWWLSFWVALVHLGFFAIPMLALRWLHPEQDFATITFFGVAGPAWHDLSKNVYMALIVATLADIWRAAHSLGAKSSVITRE